MAAARTAVLATIAASLLWLAPAPHAAVFAVNGGADAVDALPGNGVCASAGGICTLRAAVMEANALAGEDEIRLPAGVHTLARPGANEDGGATGDLDVTGAVRVAGAGAAASVVDGGGLDRVFHVLGGSVTLADLAIVGGVAGAGAAVLHAGTELRLTRVGVAFNGTPAGSAVDCESTCRVTDGEIVDNAGIGLRVSTGYAFVDRSLVARNGSHGIFVGSGGCCGGGIDVAGAQIRDNGGDGILSWEGDGAVDASALEDNAGAGFFATGDSSFALSRLRIVRNGDSGVYAGGSYSITWLSDSFVSQNQSAYGAGGVDTCCGEPVALAIERSTVTQNVGVTAGGIHAGWSASIAWSTVAANRGDLTGGLRMGEDQFSLSLVVEGTILAGNQSPLAPDCALMEAFGGSTVEGRHNLVGDGTGCAFAEDVATLVGDAATPLDPLLAPLAATSGPTPYHPLLPGSPALDAVPALDCAPAPPFPRDQRGVARPQNGACDVGAVEVTACQNGLDDDGDGAADFAADPGCRSAASTLENPRCDDGLDNDGDGGIDWDGGAPGGTPDADCAAAWAGQESPSTCGIGAELLALAPLLRRSLRVRSDRPRGERAWDF
ncbi:MAG: hypothetical protein DCC71_05145 [Proteobacteria bacterium]|nr:MAG: hypothetical protein DCC71_05145 [Pseudomonadota bacterium]